MAEKYHISPTTGNPNRCYAEKRPCPVGGPEEHFDSKEAAREASERKLAQEHGLTAKALKKPAPAKLSAANQAHVDKYIADTRARKTWSEQEVAKLEESLTRAGMASELLASNKASESPSWRGMNAFKADYYGSDTGVKLSGSVQGTVHVQIYTPDVAVGHGDDHSYSFDKSESPEAIAAFVKKKVEEQEAAQGARKERAHAFRVQEAEKRKNEAKETLAKQASAPKAPLKPIDSKALATESAEISDKLRDNETRKASLLRNAQYTGFEKTLEAMKEADDEGKKLKARQQEIAAQLKEVALKTGDLRTADPRGWHGNPARLAEVFSTADSSKTNRKPSTHYSLNAGRLNPADFTGSGSEYTSKGQNSLVVLAHKDGTRARVISSWGEMYQKPEDELGAPATQSKMRQGGWGRDAETYDLHVVGYVDTKGESHGWVPDKQVQFFVYK